MSDDTFAEAIQFYSVVRNFRVEMIALGGGEPTLHPKFWEFLEEAKRVVCLFIDQRGWSEEDEVRQHIQITTNAVDEQVTDRLIDSGVSVYISDSEWHRKARRMAGYDSRPSAALLAQVGMFGVTRTEQVVPQGRAKALPAYVQHKRCVCPSIDVDVKGRVWACGCRKKLLGASPAEARIPNGYMFAVTPCDKEMANIRASCGPEVLVGRNLLKGEVR